MKKYDYEFFMNNVLIINKQSQVDKILEDLNLADMDFKLKKHPVIVYRDNGGITFSTITKENILKLKYNSEFSRNIVELE